MSEIRKSPSEAKIGLFDAVSDLRYGPDGLIPVVVQHAATGQMLLFAWANREAIVRTLATGHAHFYSRSRGRLWKKGEESGHVQKVERIHFDCDADALLLQVRPAGPACHTNEPSCFYRALVASDGRWEAIDVHEPPLPVLHALQQVIASRKSAPPWESYVASLLAKGPEAIHEKVLEEAGEVVEASTNRGAAEIVHEIADLIFHTWVLMGHHGIAFEAIEAELRRRFGVSGHAEKAARAPKGEADPPPGGGS